VKGVKKKGCGRLSIKFAMTENVPSALSRGLEMTSPRQETALKAQLMIAVGTPVARCPPHRPGRALISVGPGLWSGQSGKELVLTEPFLHPETERSATEVGCCGSGVWLEHRSIAWSQVPCAEQWLTVGETQLIPFGRVSSIAQLGRCLQLRKRATSEKDTGR